MVKQTNHQNLENFDETQIGHQIKNNLTTVNSSELVSVLKINFKVLKNLKLNNLKKSKHKCGKQYCVSYYGEK